MEWLLKLITAPILGSIVDGYKAKLASGNTTERIAAELAGRELEVQKREAEVNAQYKIAVIGHWYEPVNLLGYIMVLYVGKVIVWDKVMASFTGGSTDSIEGAVGQWAGAIIMFLIGKRGAENIARIIKK